MICACPLPHHKRTCLQFPNVVDLCLCVCQVHVTQHDVPTVLQQHVFRLEVHIHHAVVVQVAQHRHQLRSILSHLQQTHRRRHTDADKQTQQQQQAQVQQCREASESAAA